ncbi:MAG TPA: O-antigen ligase family protein [Longimicrobiaceae bacterium]|nr:O-antigen ligase family protein [Longimicrobiaceae bacterium]
MPGRMPAGAGRGYAPPRGGASRGSAAQRVRDVWRTRPGEIWAFMKREPASFWFLNLYMFIEYVRPQMVYPAMDILPWGLTFLALALVTALSEGKLTRFPTVISGLLGFYTLVLVASSFTAFSTDASFAKFSVYLNWILVFALTVNVVTTERRFFVYMLAFLLYSFKMSQHGARSWAETGFGFRDWGATGGPGWFHNSGEFGIQMCVFFPLALGFVVGMWKHWGKWQRLFFLTFPVTAVMSMIASSSRGALLGGALTLVWMVARTRHRFKVLIPAALAVALVIVVIPPEQKARFESAGEDETSTTRITYWKHGLEIAEQHPVLGIGYGNWLPYYKTYYNPAGQLPHNIFIEAVAEMGYTGLFAFVLLIGATFVVNFRTRKVLRALPGDNAFLTQMAHGLDGALVGFLGSGFFVTVLYYPFFWINLAMTVALHVCALNKVREARSVRPGAPPSRPAEPAPAHAPRPMGRGGYYRQGSVA